MTRSGLCWWIHSISRFSYSFHFSSSLRNALSSTLEGWSKRQRVQLSKRPLVLRVQPPRGQPVDRRRAQTLRGSRSGGPAYEGFMAASLKTWHSLSSVLPSGQVEVTKQSDGPEDSTLFALTPTAASATTLPRQAKGSATLHCGEHERGLPHPAKNPLAMAVARRLAQQEQGRSRGAGQGAIAGEHDTA